MNKDVIKKAQEEIDNNSKQTERYSIYDYLKKTPSVLIAGSSAAVAVVTFLARLITNINIRKNLMFWNIDTNSISLDNSTLLFQSLMCIFYMLLTAVIVICVDSIYKSYVPVKKYKFASKCLKKIYKSKKRTEEYKKFIANDKKLRKLLNLIHFLKMLGIYVLSFIGTSLYIFTSSTENKYLFIVILICSVIQFSLLFLLSKSKANSINKEEIKKDCENGDYKKHIELKWFPTTNEDKSIRKYFSNKNLSLFALQIIVSCLFLCVTSMFLPVKKVNENSNIQIVSSNKQEYFVAYQDGEKIFAKEIEVVVEEETEKEILVIHKDKQITLASDNVNIEIRMYDKVKILDIGEEYQ